jgi:hypothetical protein
LPALIDGDPAGFEQVLTLTERLKADLPRMLAERRPSSALDLLRPQAMRRAATMRAVCEAKLHAQNEEQFRIQRPSLSVNTSVEAERVKSFGDMKERIEMKLKQTFNGQGIRRLVLALTLAVGSLP